MGAVAVEEEYAAPAAATSLSRRAFVKGTLGAATLGVGGAAGFGMFRQTTLPTDFQVRYVRYLGTERGPKTPAPRGLPFIPVRLDEAGFITALPEHEGTSYLDLLRYCGVVNAPQLADPGHTADNVLRFQVVESHLHQAEDPSLFWYRDRHGARVRAADFASRPYGSGASVRWRSEGVPGGEQVNLVLMKLDPALFPDGSEAFLSTFMEPEHHLIALSGHCTHFCCTPGYKYTARAVTYDAWEKVYCSCHHSVFDPYRAVEYTFMLREKRGEA